MMGLDYIKNLVGALVFIVKCMFSKRETTDEIMDSVYDVIVSTVVTFVCLVGIKHIFFAIYKNVFLILADAYAMEIIIGKFDVLFGISNNTKCSIMVIVLLLLNKLVIRAIKACSSTISDVLSKISETFYLDITKIGSTIDEYDYDTTVSIEYAVYRVRFAMLDYTRETFFGAESLVSVDLKIDQSKVVHVIDIEEPQEQLLLACEM